MRRPIFDPNWPSEVQEINRNDLREIWDPTAEPQTYSLYQNQLRLYLGLVDNYGAQSVLDVGCAQGTLALLLAEAGRSVTAVDIRPSFLEYARTRYERGDIRFVEANVMDRPSLGEFDLVFANQIVEHLVYPEAFVRALSGYAKPGGVVVITTPNQEYLRCGLPRFGDLGDPSQYESRQFSAGGGDHFFAYTAQELVKIVRAAGLDVDRTFFFESPWISGHMRVRHLLPWLSEGFRRVADRTTLALLGRRLGHHVAVVGRRPS